MFANVSIPGRGQKMRASWAQQVSERLNALQPFASAGGLRREGAGGFGTAPLPANRRDRAAQPLPWQFACAEDENGDRTGGWTNGRLQVGYDVGWVTPDLRAGEAATSAMHTIPGHDCCGDGYHYIVANFAPDAANVIEIVAYNQPKSSEYYNNVVRVYLGHVVDGKLVEGTHMVPVIYHYV